MKENDSPLFYVKLRSDFDEKYNESCSQNSLFPQIDDPYQKAAGRINSDKIYPVFKVIGKNDILIPDDKGQLLQINSMIFKFVEPK